MDAARISRLYAAGQITAPQIMRAAALGLIPVEAVPAEVGDAAAYLATRQQIESDITAGLQAIRDASATLDAVITAAQGIEGFAGTTITQAQTIATLKQLATGVRLLAQGEKLALRDVDYLARLQLWLPDATG